MFPSLLPATARVCMTVVPTDKKKPRMETFICIFSFYLQVLKTKSRRSRRRFCMSDRFCPFLGLGGIFFACMWMCMRFLPEGGGKGGEGGQLVSLMQLTSLHNEANATCLFSMMITRQWSLKTDTEIAKKKKMQFMHFAAS